MRPLLEALECLGAKFQFLEDEYCFPFEILGREESSEKKKVSLNIDASSQFLSALLLNGVFSKTGFDVVLTGKSVRENFDENDGRVWCFHASEIGK